MRIDATSLLLAAQIQPQRANSAQVPKALAAAPAAKQEAAAGAAKPPQSGQFQPLSFSNAAPSAPAAKPASPGPLSRPGSQLDIKV
jgi:hypothetical protein